MLHVAKLRAMLKAPKPAGMEVMSTPIIEITATSPVKYAEYLEHLIIPFASVRTIY